MPKRLHEQYPAVYEWPCANGYLAFTESTEFDGIVSTLLSTISLGSLTQQCSENTPAAPTCAGAFDLPLGNGAGVVPFTLGQSFAFSQSVSAEASGGDSIPHFGQGPVSFSFTLLEADGITPVQVYAAPVRICPFVAAAEAHVSNAARAANMTV